MLLASVYISGLQIRGSKGHFSIYFWNSALKIELKGENTLCSLRFQRVYSIHVVKSFILSKTKLHVIQGLVKNN